MTNSVKNKTHAEVHVHVYQSKQQISGRVVVCLLEKSTNNNLCLVKI